MKRRGCCFTQRHKQLVEHSCNSFKHISGSFNHTTEYNDNKRVRTHNKGQKLTSQLCPGYSND